MWPFRVTVSRKNLLTVVASQQAQLALHRQAMQKLTEGIRTQSEAMRELIKGMRELDARIDNVCTTCNSRYDRQAAQIGEQHRRLDGMKGVHGA